MEQVSSSELNTRPGAVLRRAKSGAIEITNHGKAEVVMLPADQYQRMGGEQARLLAIIREVQDEAEKNGLTQEIIDEVLKEDA